MMRFIRGKEGKMMVQEEKRTCWSTVLRKARWGYQCKENLVLPLVNGKWKLWPKALEGGLKW
jgi:hypothetical protein